MRIQNVTRGIELAGRARAARSIWSRMAGLLGRWSLEPGEGLLIDPCSSVHTAFMRFPIDVLYLDPSARVIKTAPNMRPFRFSGALGGARSVVELPAGTLDGTGTAVGDLLSFSEE